MDYVNFGSAGVKVSRLALGMGLRGQADEATAQRLVEHALDRGVNLINYVNVYGPMGHRANIGQSEVVLGRALKGRRDDVVITSKVCGRIGPGPMTWAYTLSHPARSRALPAPAQHRPH